MSKRDPKILAAMDRVFLSIMARRCAQIDRGYDATHDDDHGNGDIVSDTEWGAAARLRNASYYKNANDAGRREELVVAASLLVAEIERIDRANIRAMKDCEP